MAVKSDGARAAKKPTRTAHSPQMIASEETSSSVLLHIRLT